MTPADSVSGSTNAPRAHRLGLVLGEGRVEKLNLERLQRLEVELD